MISIGFSANECGKAVDFYAKVFRSEVRRLMTYGQMPPDPDSPVFDADKEHVVYWNAISA